MLLSHDQVRFAETIYVSGWQASSHHSSINEPGPDLADYPLDTVLYPQP
eukprot:CAMPEP_0180211138 /NCGR_PEP_ID=MMETSP0987-20121128/12617_1 /TAXON_ID=697907 /ORGANISM="non described non described, Strain CCMP2293" /LENGTH=48 /DNA_ID= /DNA_START= /DNA_END= /DNA_ORIENTATION=